MARFGRSVAVTLGALGAWGITALTPSITPASAATTGEVLALLLQPCPAYEVASSHDRSPATVAQAKAGTFVVRTGRPATLVPPVDWSQDPYNDRSWVHYLHGFMWLDQLLYAYVHDGDVVALAQARDLLLDWIASNPLPAGEPQENWKDKATGDRSGYLAFVARAAACRGLLSHGQASTLLDSLRRHAGVLGNPDAYEPTNHGLFVDLGLALLGRYLGFLPDGAGYLELARSRFQSTLLGRLSEDEGIWLEQSTGYQFLVIRLVERFQALFDPGAYDDDLALMREAAGWLVLPSGDQVPYGDSNETPAPGWAREEAADDEGLLLMPQSGLAAVKDGDGYLLVTAGFFNRTHKHADDLGFHLYDRGQDVISDSGVLDYNLDKWRGFARSVAAHSVLSVGRRNFAIDTDKRIYGSGIVAGGQGQGWYAIEGRNPLLRVQGVHHRRLFLYRPGRALLVIDLVHAKGERTYHRRFQLAPQIEPRRRRGKLLLRGDGLRGALVDAGDPARLEIDEGHYTPPRGWSFPGHGQRVPRPTLKLNSRARNASFLAAFGLRGTVRARLIDAGKRSVRVRVAGHAVGRRSTLKVSRLGDRLVVTREHGARAGHQPNAGHRLKISR